MKNDNFTMLVSKNAEVTKLTWSNKWILRTFREGERKNSKHVKVSISHTAAADRHVNFNLHKLCATLV